jgi:hypothetical protein
VDQYYFETTKAIRSNDPGRVRPRFSERINQSETRKQSEIANQKIAAARIQDLISRLERTVLSLNGSIDAILQGDQVRDPSHFAYPIAARTMSARRDNIRDTIAVLSQQLVDIINAQSAP